MLVKIYGSPTGAGDERRYSPAVCTGTDKRPITGSLDRRDRGRDRPYERPRTQVPAFVANAPRLSTYTGLDEHRPRHPVAGPAPNGLALALAARSLPAKTRYVTPLLTALTPKAIGPCARPCVNVAALNSPASLRLPASAWKHVLSTDLPTTARPAALISRQPAVLLPRSFVRASQEIA